MVTLQFTGTYWMRIALPAAHGRAALDAAEASLHVAIGPIDEAKICGDVDVAIPKWKAEATFARLTGALKAMGATQVFTKSADLTAISPAAAKVGLYVSNVVHRATIDVDEQGTIAAAATAEIGRASSEPLVQPTCPKLVELNRPFAYVIQHQNGEILFAGRVDDPSLK